MNAAHSDTIVLASGSSIRRRLLEAARIPFEVDPADIDEEALVEADPVRRAAALARAKAAVVSARRPGRFVLGADQVFALEGRLFPKPESKDAARKMLMLMAGKTHRFACGFCLMRDGRVLEEGVDQAAVTFWRFPETVAAWYAETGEGLGCAGAYRLEEGGIRLIEKIEGDHFTILGLPMVPFVAAWRRHVAGSAAN